MVFQQRAFDSGKGYMYLQSVAEYMQPEHKASERSQPEMTVKYLNLIYHYVDTIFLVPDLGRGQGLSTGLGDWKKIWKFAYININ